MKKNEIAVLILVASLAAFVTYLIANALLGGHTAQPVDVESATPISSEITQPSKEIFNSKAINPTVPIKIGDGDNKSPFNN